MISARKHTEEKAATKTTVLIPRVAEAAFELLGSKETKQNKPSKSRMVVSTE